MPGPARQLVDDGGVSQREVYEARTRQLAGGDHLVGRARGDDRRGQFPGVDAEPASQRKAAVGLEVGVVGAPQLRVEALGPAARQGLHGAAQPQVELVVE